MKILKIISFGDPPPTTPVVMFVSSAASEYKSKLSMQNEMFSNDGLNSINSVDLNITDASIYFSPKKVT